MSNTIRPGTHHVKAGRINCYWIVRTDDGKSPVTVPALVAIGVGGVDGSIMTLMTALETRLP
jgi:hypothetical protein